MSITRGEKLTTMQVLGLNLHDRPVEQTLPLFASIVNTPGHPLRAEAVDTLRFHLHEKADATGAALAQNIEAWLQARQEVVGNR